MPRVIVTTSPSELPRDLSVLLDEQVHSVNLSSDHSAAQLVERIAWAIDDAEDAETSRRSAPASTSLSQDGRPSSARRRPGTRPTRSSGTRRPYVAAS